ncbi:hypothetical protein V2G26_000917 [Clonostachys chloroleuca]
MSEDGQKEANIPKTNKPNRKRAFLSPVLDVYPIAPGQIFVVFPVAKGLVRFWHRQSEPRDATSAGQNRASLWGPHIVAGGSTSMALAMKATDQCRRSTRHPAQAFVAGQRTGVDAGADVGVDAARRLALLGWPSYTSGGPFNLGV